MEKKTMTPDTTPKVDTMMLKDTIEKPVDTIGKSETMMKKESGYQAYSPALVSSALVS
jgi:hypothetical protein